MFGQWRQSRLQSTRRALADGRLDEALTLLAGLADSNQPEAAELKGAAQRMLVARARVRRQEGALGAATADLEQAAALGPLPDSARELLARLARLKERLGRAAAALERRELLAAVDHWNEARQRFGQSAEQELLGRRLAEALRAELSDWLRDGRIDWLSAAEPALQALLPLDPRLAEDQRVLRLLGQATRQLALREFDEVREILLRLTAVRPALSWVETCQEALVQIRRGEEILLRSPLGVFIAWPESSVLESPHAAVGATARPARPAAGGATGLRFDRPRLALIDGAGSVLLAPAERVRIGRAGGETVDVPIPADLWSHHAEIRRESDDYYLTAYGPVEINRQPVRTARLRDGDRVALGPQARFVFVRPTAKSESVVLRLSHRCRLAQDVSQVVLLADTCVIGPQASCHIRTSEDGPPAVLFVRDGVLHLRTEHGPAAPVEAGRPLECGEVRLTVTEYEPRTG